MGPRWAVGYTRLSAKFIDDTGSADTVTMGYTRLSAKCIDDTGSADTATMVAHATTHV